MVIPLLPGCLKPYKSGYPNILVKRETSEVQLSLIEVGRVYFLLMAVNRFICSIRAMVIARRCSSPPSIRL